MQILSEIVETSDKMITLMEESGFFKDNPFLEPKGLKLALQKRMQWKWEQEKEMILTDTEFLEVCQSEVEKAVGETLEGLFQKGAITMSVGDDGEVYYSANPDFDVNKLNED